MDYLSETELDLMIRRRKSLSRAKRHLEARCYEEFVETGDMDLVRKIRQVAAQLYVLNKEIHFIKKSGRANDRLLHIKTSDFRKMAENSYAFETGSGR